MSKKIAFAVALVGLCALSFVLISCGSSSYRPTTTLYVLTEGVTSQGNASGFGNNVSSFAIDLDNGGLSLINYNASTCPTAASVANPEPCGLPLSILLDPTGATAFVLDQGLPSAGVAPAIYSYTVNSDGSLGSPNLAATLTLGDLPVAMTRDPAGQFLFVIDEGTNPTPQNCGQAPNPVTIQCASINVFSAKPGSTTLSPVTGSPFPVNRTPSALSVIPFTPPVGSTLPCTATADLLFVTYNSDPVHQNDNTFSAYCVDSSAGSSGNVIDLTPNSPYAIASTLPTAVIAVNTNPAGENTGGVFLYVGSQPPDSGALSMFQVCTQDGQGTCTSPPQVNNATLVPVGAQPPTTGADPVAMMVDPTNNYLYVLCELSNQVFGYRITTSSGALTRLNPVYEPTGSDPTSLAMQPSTESSNEYLFVSNSNSDSISGFNVSTTTGGLTPLSPTLSNPGPTGMAAQ